MLKKITLTVLLFAVIHLYAQFTYLPPTGHGAKKAAISKTMICCIGNDEDYPDNGRIMYRYTADKTAAWITLLDNGCQVFAKSVWATFNDAFVYVDRNDVWKMVVFINGTGTCFDMPLLDVCQPSNMDLHFYGNPDLILNGIGKIISENDASHSIMVSPESSASQPEKMIFRCSLGTVNKFISMAYDVWPIFYRSSDKKFYLSDVDQNLVSRDFYRSGTVKKIIYTLTMLSGVFDKPFVLTNNQELYRGNTYNMHNNRTPTAKWYCVGSYIDDVDKDPSTGEMVYVKWGGVFQGQFDF